jgi:hypothetical protein
MLAVLSGGVRDGRIYYVDADAPSVDFDNGPGRAGERYVRSQPEESQFTALGAAVVFQLSDDDSPRANGTGDSADGSRPAVSPSDLRAREKPSLLR